MINNEEEIWKAHPEYVEIEVSTLGNVRTLDKVVSSETMTRFTKGRVLKQYLNHNGYLKVRIPVDGKWAMKRAHRLVAQTFIPNPDNLPQVNHKSCIRTNNNVENLEWCTRQENIAYRDKLGHTARNNAPKSPVLSVNLKTLEVLRFCSQHEAGRELGVDNSSINSVVKGRQKQAHGFWFVNDDGHAVDVVKSKLHDIGGTGLKIYS